MDEWEQLRTRLAAAGVSGVDDLGRFVSKPEFFGESSFDERAAMPILLQALPSLTDRTLVSAVAGHLRRPWARPEAFEALRAAFDVWAQRDPLGSGWQLGDALGSAATASYVETMVGISQNAKYGRARQMVVFALGRFKAAPEVAQTLIGLLKDPDVSLHAMKALRRVLGAEEALPYLESVAREHPDTVVGEQASREAKKVRKSLS